VAQHPSESNEYLVTRVLAYCLEYTEGSHSPRACPIRMSRPSRCTISPAFSRLGSTSVCPKPRVCIRPARQRGGWLSTLTARSHLGSPDWKVSGFTAPSVEIHVMDRDLVAALASRLQRRMELDFSVSDRNLYVSVGEATFSGTVEARRLMA